MKVKCHDVFESWLDINDSIPRIDGYTNFRSDCKKKSRAKRTSGGLIVYCKNMIAGGVTKISSKIRDAIWLKFDQNYFGLENDLYIVITYIPPESSTYYVENSDFDHFDILSKEIER